MLLSSFLPLLTVLPLASSKLLTFHPIRYHLNSKLSPPPSSLIQSNAGRHTPESPSSLYLPIRTTTRTVSRPLRHASLNPLVGGEGAQGVFDRLRLRRSLREEEQVEWEDNDMEMPDLEDMATVVNLAKMANDAYASGPGDPRWMELDKYGLALPIGYDSSTSGGLRGHVFATPDNSTLIVSFKGTSIDAPGLPSPNSTAKLDRINDNRLFSCCCGHLEPTSPNVCPCFKGGGRLHREKKVCDQSCVELSLWEEDSYYPQALILLSNLLFHHPTSSIFLIGHSMGGAIASLLSHTLSLPAVTFETPPDALAVSRLGFPQLPAEEWRKSPVAHVFHTGDMVAVAKCKGPLSWCWRFGYAMESLCHTGRLIIYRTVEKWNWSIDLTGRSHTIAYAIENVYSKPWNDGEGSDPAGRGRDWTDVPREEGERDGCVDCGDWKFY